MKTTFKSIALVILYLLTTAKSCDQNGTSADSKKIEATTDSLKGQFGTFPDGTQKQAYECNALQLFRDMEDYLRILSDSSQPELFRNQAGQMFRKSFRDSRTSLRFVRTFDNHVTNKLILDISTGGLDYVPVDSVWISSPLTMLNDSVMEGSLGYLSNPVKGGIGYSFQGKQIRIFAVKRLHRFGKTIIPAWTVLLGNNDFR